MRPHAAIFAPHAAVLHPHTLVFTPHATHAAVSTPLRPHHRPHALCALVVAAHAPTHPTPPPTPPFRTHAPPRPRFHPRHRRFVPPTPHHPHTLVFIPHTPHAALVPPPCPQEQPVKKTRVSAAKKTTKTKKDKKTSADRDAEDKAAKAVAKKNMTLTSKILQQSGAGVAPPPRSTGTGIQIPSTTPRIVSDRARRPDPASGDDEDPQLDTDSKNNSNSGDEEDLPVIKDKGKGKARDLHNLGALSDKDSDADADVGDKENDDEDVDEDAAGDAEGEVAGVGDGSGDDEGDATIMDVDVNITPRKPAKRDASQSPLTDKHTGKAQRRNVSHSSAASTPVNDVPPIETHGKGKVVMHTTLGMTDMPHSVTMARFPTLAPILKILTRKFPTVTESAISVLDVDAEWEVAGPYALALEDDMEVTWNNDFKLFMLLMVVDYGVELHLVVR
ncbi:hypothetical protein EYR38_010117 [Pleurotus pulmonarius]|nr:hypothetical protein EYR38_010117 [Pleurotus pulmonarius]